MIYFTTFTEKEIIEVTHHCISKGNTCTGGPRIAGAMNNLTVDSGQMVPIIRIIIIIIILTRGKWCRSSSGSSLSLSSPRPKQLNNCQLNKSEGEITIDCSDCQERQAIKPDRLQLADIIKINHHYCHYYYHDSNYSYYHYYPYHYHVRPSSIATLTSLAW